MPPDDAARDHLRERIPRLLRELNSEDCTEQREALRLSCPCRNVRYDRELWRMIFDVYESAQTVLVRDQALHAIETLLQRARTDPRSQELLRWLADNGVTSLNVEDKIPVWQPVGRGGLNGLYIPRYEHSPRSRRNCRR